MILSGKEIARQRELGNIVIDPFDPAKCGPNSYDVTLAPELLTYRPQSEQVIGAHGFVTIRNVPPTLDVRQKPDTQEILIPEQGFILKPGMLYLASTNEVAGSTVYAPMCDGRSSVARLGMFIHTSAGFGDVGFVGRWTLEIVVVHPVRVYAGMKIAQIWFASVEGERHQYVGKYNGAAGVEASKLYKDFEK